MSGFLTEAVDIVGTGGFTHDFGTTAGGPLQRIHMAALERASHYAVTLSDSGTVPYAVQMDFTHDTGVGKAYVVEPISGVKNISWTDDGSTLRVVILPAEETSVRTIDDFKFYVAGGVTNLAPISTQAFNIDGVTVTGVSPTVTPHNIVIADGL